MPSDRKLPKAPSPESLDALARIVGEEHAIRDPREMERYLVEWRDRYRGRAALVLKPGSTQEVSAILEHANGSGTAIVPQGGNTGLVGGQIPFESGRAHPVGEGRGAGRAGGDLPALLELHRGAVPPAIRGGH